MDATTAPHAAAQRPKLYEQVAARVVQAIESGTLRAGDRLPSVRVLSEQEGVSISTVLQAYMQLESLGFIETRPQSGHYVRARFASLAEEPPVSQPPATARPVSVSGLVAEVYAAANDPRIVPLGAATVSSELLPVQRLVRHLSAAAREEPGGGADYQMPPGCPRLRQQLARRSLTWGCALGPGDFITTCGASEAVHLSLLAVARPGDTVAVESPAYYGTLRALEALGLKALEIPSHPRDGMLLDALEAALSRRRLAAVVVVPNFSNPLGSLMPDEAKERLVAMLARHEVPLIEDDIYADLHFGPVRPKVCKAFDRKGLVLLCSSFSKTLAPGYRVGWVAPGRFRERVELLKFAQTVATATLPQRALARLLESGGYDKHLRTLRRHLATQVQRMSESITRHFPSGTRLTRPAGGTMLWVQLPGRVDALDVHRRALEAGISVAPGPIFSAQESAYRHFLRINCGYPWSPQLEAATATLGRIVATLA